MKSVDADEIKAVSGKHLEATDTFCFRCHPGLACFNKCCRNLNLFLYPYDVLRLKNSMGISSDVFLERHVDIVLRDSNHFPEVLLRMADSQEKACPFLSESGCRVYADRPDACRSFPVENGVLFDNEGNVAEKISFFRPPEFCLGQRETDRWTLDSWCDDQEAADYHEMTIRWADLKRLFQSDPWGAEGPSGPRAKMAFMATYNLDRFREFVLGSSFLRRYRVQTIAINKVRRDDTALMLLGFAWVKLFLWGIDTPLIKRNRK